MTHQNGTWSPYAGSNSIILAVGLLIVTGVLMYFAMRLHHPIAVKRPGKFIGISIVVIWVLSVATFLVAVTTYVLCSISRWVSLTGPDEPHRNSRYRCSQDWLPFS